MSTSANHGQAPDPNPDANQQNEGEEDDDSNFDPQEYDTLLHIERLETLEEEMQELGVTTLEEVRRRIEELHRQLD